MSYDGRKRLSRDICLGFLTAAALGITATMSGPVFAQDGEVGTTVLPAPGVGTGAEMDAGMGHDGAGAGADLSGGTARTAVEHGAAPDLGEVVDAVTGAVGGVVEDATGGAVDSTVGLIEAPEGQAAYDAETMAADPQLQNQFLETSPVPAQSPAIARFAAGTPGPQLHPPVVVELFTSQGCSSCPPADAMLGDLSGRADVLALSWHVDYWDYLGWADEFARPEFTRRQKDYACNAGERSIYTPQILVGGSETLIDLRPAELIAMIEAQMARPVAVSVTSSQVGDTFQIELTPRARLRNSTAILLIRYAPERQVTIRAGENRGIQVTYRNVVVAVEKVADWDGRAPLRLNVKAASNADQSFPDDTRHAILAQQLGRKGLVAGPILAAVKLD
ncbi:DUF1223 domain-containing protein [Paracoccus sp. DMF-8]|uniref:DUF1223 domain-containing protein n=1 Tax=Paracoccus sp. DMF-8 TaxID=3019445 RepID=UPI0023E3DF03|nr:DUF1223 domain-containing protein [Paracoccus sp. DMF-8]MDF3608417.1 DUF1223 domain-containing protein [Paracoccus sp. DMF-8]